jgi:dihydroflavonol-4-reductase
MGKPFAVFARSANPFWIGTPVCVLGGSGFLGRHLVEQLLDAGAVVRTLSLPGPELGDAHPRLDARTGDVTDVSTVQEAVAGARIVFLAAGPVGAGPNAARKMGAHPTALDSVLAAVPDGTRLVLTSSIVAVGGTPDGTVLDEDAPFPNSALPVAYVRAKRTSDEMAVAAGRSRDVVVVNPGYLFGPDDPGPSVMGHLCLRFWRGHVALPPGGGISAVDVRDVAAGHLLAAEFGVSGRRYILGGENVRFAELFKALAAAANLRRAVLPSFRPAVPHWMLWGAAAVASCATALTGKESDLSFEFVSLNRLCWFVSSARAESELGYRCRPLRETLADSHAWHAAQHRVGPRGLNRLWLRRAA